MKFITGEFNASGTIVVNDMTEVDRTLAEVYEELRMHGRLSVCYLTLPSNLPGRGNLVDPKVDESTYLSNPAKYGLAVYKNWNGKLEIE